ncbi:hypothetical protein COCCADRAFT_7975 [Bipolaris zeicola 26-R-13]|uniref:Uncharacterized protein n=1 Tax=Cochliobolus carbonum (strain 26-R-13) TaxID=930089 RepID=W6XVV0_COCC2|nr:uncharacterized protein COCCADRAFT_7975 [Bipolaris zeicola 26-R-13]EUC29873.1 hypothetical protein COCCADRAFT_7975 [Bipolaris zeicola 26-R-13]
MEKLLKKCESSTPSIEVTEVFATSQNKVETTLVFDAWSLEALLNKGPFELTPSHLVIRHGQRKLRLRFIRAPETNLSGRQQTLNYWVKNPR